jgi:hypothetical protein
MVIKYVIGNSMKIESVVLTVKTIQVTCIFSVAMVVLVMLLDFMLPTFSTMLQDPIRRGWCGIFMRCASGMEQTFVEFLWSGEPWKSLSFGMIKIRVVKAALVGVFAGVGFSVTLFASIRR